jgi:regulator of replication initiation timing
MTSLESQLRASVALIQTRKAAEHINSLNENLNDRIMDLHAENERLRTQVMAVQCINDTLRRQNEKLQEQLRFAQIRERGRLALVAGTEVENVFTHTQQI